MKRKALRIVALVMSVIMILGAMTIKFAALVVLPHMFFIIE